MCSQVSVEVDLILCGKLFNIGKTTELLLMIPLWLLTTPAC